MTNDQMREAFEARLSPVWSRDRIVDDEGEEQYADLWVQGAWIGWQAGVAAGMERAAGICEALNDSAGDAASYDGRDMYPGEQERMQAINACADAIRAEMAQAVAARDEAGMGVLVAVTGGTR